MMAPGIPENEVLRLRTLSSTELLDSSREGQFDWLTDTVRLCFEVPICAFTLIDEHRQWFKSIHGLNLRETPRDISFCGHVIHQDQTIVIPDAQLDPRFADNPLVVGDPHIRFYAGTPIRVDMAGEALDLGSLCVIDRRSRTLDRKQIAILEGFARQIETLVEMHLVNLHLLDTCDQLKHTVKRFEDSEKRVQQISVLANTDSLTGLGNVRHFNNILERILKTSRRKDEHTSLVLIDVDDFKTINNSEGYLAGDEMLRKLADILTRVVRKGNDHIFRLGGDEFAIVLSGITPKETEVLAKRIITEASGIPTSPSETFSVSLGITNVHHRESDQRSIFDRADRALSSAKRAGRGRFCVQSAREV
ncbi:MAG: sensor domain-containing diguanylate cyclase [Marinobacter sp.]|uniref:sensor domain-containing diguanylate cyclase n=1 Tax=Marinobacter sp. TaxID=50741 RepID=UPI0034A0A145